ncbi:hypothetical protein OHC33_002229 [Knufia fluminis]|uniref:Uncharacterized protein n=1 Tax=Knufia fluminis TaxID=191047 RepID=A0AAN8ER45_9EURO|nr:hypothetical protein OHC33_002229 [Knufia fluminis]
MADSRWTITSTKRRRTTTTPAPRKRARISDDVSAASTSRRRTVGQQTLTQIDFVNSPSFEDGDELDSTPLEPIGPATGQAHVGSGRQRLKKRDSTLTQMNVVKSSSLEDDDGLEQTEMEPIGQPEVRPARRRLKKRDSTLTQMDFFDPLTAEATNLLDDHMIGTPLVENAGRRPPVPAFDGAQDDQPQPPTTMGKPRSRPKKSARTTTAAKKAEKVKSSEDQEEYQDHQPRKRRKVHIDESNQGQENRRRSGRLASATASGTSSNAGREETVSQPASRGRRPHIDSTGRPVLVVQDSTDFTEPSLDPTSRLAVMMAQPVTPTKDRDRIPSSQTPETLSRTRQTRSNRRRPLAELDKNIQKTPSKVAKTSKPVKSPQKHSPPRKICVLKVPPRALLPRSNRVEDSQQDVWSVQATSSPRRDKGTPQTKPKQAQRTRASQSQAKTPTQLSKSQSDAPSIHESTPRAEIDTQKSLPDISTIFGLTDASSPEVTKSDHAAPVSTPTAAVNVEAKSRSNAASVHEGTPLHQGLVNMIPELDKVSSDELSDFGSPVANDTQFVKSLHNRVSSPVPGLNEDRHRATTAPAEGKTPSSAPRRLSRASMPASPPKLSPLPAPRLVTTSPLRTLQPRVLGSSTESLPLLAAKVRSPNKATDRVRITKVPLNDTNDYLRLSSSSSPLLPPPPIPTQKSVHPASIPHPSQVSTQAPSTQGFFFPTSSAPNSFLVHREPEVESITIKDSSSVPARLSQFRQHVQDGELNAEGEIRLVESGDEDDLDLDPSTWKAATPKKSMDGGLPGSEDIVGENEVTQTPTQKLRPRSSLIRRETTQSSPVVTNATTRSQRDANLEVIALPSSSQPASDQRDDYQTPRASRMSKNATTQVRDFADDQHNQQSPPSSSLSSSIFSPSPPRQLQRKYSPIPGFDNDTQSDFTQDGHVTAAYIHRMREEGLLPKNYVPKPFKPKNWSKSMRSDRQKEKAKVGKN